MLHLFNPQNDLALGLDCRHYTPQPSVAAFVADCGLLPMWWGAEGDRVLVGRHGLARSLETARRLADRYGLHGLPVAEAVEEEQCEPWGWSRDARRIFAEAGVGEKCLPTDGELARWRALSGRQTAVELLRRLDSGFQLPLVTESVDGALEMISGQPGCYVKSPWSGSGRGVFLADSLPRLALGKRLEGIVHRQGCVVVEPGYDKALDFASLYQGDGRRVSFVGYSVFRAAAEGAYQGNLVAPQTQLEETVGADFNPRVLEPHLTALLRGYSGPVGVDMMRLRDGRVMPCVELNLRRTMGHVAMSVHKALRPAAPFWLTDPRELLEIR